LVPQDGQRFRIHDEHRRSNMATATAPGIESMGVTQGAANHDHDLIQDLSKRLDSLWRYDQYIANADGKPHLQDCWRQFKKQEQENVKMLKELIAEEIQVGCF
jgi:hypothetical protein